MEETKRWAGLSCCMDEHTWCHVARWGLGRPTSQCHWCSSSIANHFNAMAFLIILGIQTWCGGIFSIPWNLGGHSIAHSKIKQSIMHLVTLEYNTIPIRVVWIQGHAISCCNEDAMLILCLLFMVEVEHVGSIRTRSKANLQV